MIQQHSKDAFLISAARLIERASYYGFRTFIVVFMIEGLKMDRMEALSIYGSFTIGVYLFQIIGAALGDFLFGNKNAFIIGCVIQSAGIFTLYFNPESTLHFSLFMIAFGTAIINPNIIALFGKQYLNNKNLLNSGFTLFYGCVTLGAFLGIMAISSGASTIDYKLCILITGSLSIVAAAVLYSTQPQQQIKRELKPKIKALPIVLVVLGTITVGLFWSLFEDVARFQVDLLRQMSSEGNNGRNWGWYTELSTYFTLGFCLLGFIILSFAKIKSSFQLAAGVIVGLLGFSLMLQVSGDDPEGAMPLFMVSAFLLALAEVLIMPASLALYVKFSNPKTIATLYAVGATAIFVITRAVPYAIKEYNLTSTLEKATLFAITCLAIAGTIIFLVGLFTPEKNTEVAFEEPEDPNVDLLDQ